MLNKYDWKNIIKRIIIGVGIAFILFNINKCNAFALDLKSSVYFNGLNDNRQTGSLTNNSEVWKDIVFTNDFSLSNYDYDYVIFRLRELNFTNSSASLIDSDINTRCTYWAQDTSGNNVNYRCNSTSSDTLQNYQYVPFDVSVSVFLANSSGTGMTCIFDDTLKDHIICPIVRDNYTIHRITFIMQSLTPGANNNVSYAIRLDKTIYFGNKESTEIVNGLSGIQQQQTQTNTIISDTNTSSSSTSANSGFNNMNSQLTQQVDSLASINTYNNIINNFFTQINNSTCSPISLPMPFVEGKNIVLPCIGTEINNSAPTLWTFWRFMCAGIIGFALWGNMIAFIKGVVDPYNIGANNLPLGGGK